MKAAGVRPGFRLLGQRAEVPLAAPVASGAADPAVEHLPVLERDAVAELGDQLDELGFPFLTFQLVHHLEGDRRDHPLVIGQARLGNQDEELAVPQPVDDLPRGLLAGELPEELLDVLDFERPGFKGVLLDQVFH